MMKNDPEAKIREKLKRKAAADRKSGKTAKRARRVKQLVKKHPEVLK